MKSKNDLSMTEHFKELRMRVVISALIILGCFIAIFLKARPIIDFVVEPVRRMDYGLHIVKLHEEFFSALRLAFIGALVIAAPACIYVLGGFITPAVSERGKLEIAITALISLLLAAGGFIFSYTILLPLCLDFLLNYSAGDFIHILSLESYLNFFLRMIIASGLGFQLPLFLLLLNKLGLVDYKMLGGFRKYALPGILLFSAVLTPPDVISQLLLGAPLYLLYEAGILLTSIFHRKNKTIKEV